VFELTGVVRSFEGKPALDGLDLAVERGRTTVLLGPSGCGKSTALRLMIGLLAPDRGEVRFERAPVTADRLADLRQRVGYVIQEGGLFPHLTARENTALAAGRLGWSAERIERRLGELGSLVHFPADGWRRYPVELSGGQRQRVALMRGLMLDPDVLLLDEPLGALDPIIRNELQSELRLLFRELGKTVVLVTHDLGEAGYLGDRIYLLQRGRVVQSGTFSDLVDRPTDAFVTRFVHAQRGVHQDDAP
jgi:osmoprotectant transport system ATP-binding protein